MALCGIITTIGTDGTTIVGTTRIITTTGDGEAMVTDGTIIHHTIIILHTIITDTIATTTIIEADGLIPIAKVEGDTTTETA